MTTAAGPQPGLAEAGASSARSDRIARLTRDPWWALPFIGLVGMLPLVVRRVGDPDFWWHVRTGQWMVQNHAIARHDLYTYTVAGTPWTAHEYLSQLIFYALNRVGGLVAVSVFFGAVVWGGFLAVFARVRQRAYSPLIAGAALLLGAAAGFPVWGPRPQMFDFLFSAIELYWLERFLSGRTRIIWYLPLLVLLWANLHGGFIFAFFFLGSAVLALLIHWAVDRDGGHLRAARTLVAVGALAVVAGMLTPNGPSLYLYVWKTQFSSVMSAFIREWQSPDFHAANMLPFAFMLIAAVAGFAWRRPRLHDVLYGVASGALALHAWRF
ncbi:MAG TPA: hypothetical protein VEY89_14285, partial [Candidatus Dormibacteraeota bacterium]|nr:hypothetical protein [Candidatus Dormibacteraeota bacterium]